LPITLKAVVQQVSNALSSEIGNTVKFKHNGFTALMNELIADSRSPVRKNDRYPLIALIQPFKSNYTVKNGAIDATFDLLICMLSDPNTPADTRETNSYNAILRPIHAELLERIKRYQYISYVGRYPQHTATDIYNMGDAAGNKNGYTFPDCVDAILIEGMQLTVYANTCIPTNTNCVAKHSVKLYDAINTVTVDTSVLGLVIEITSVSHVNSTGGDPSPTYVLNMGYIDNDFNMAVNVPFDYNVTDIPDGTYIGKIVSSYGAQYWFEYTVRSGVVTSYVHMYDFLADYGTLDCNDYFNYPLGISLSAFAFNDTFTGIGLSTLDGNVLNEVTYTPASEDTQYTYATEIDSLPSGYLVNIYTTRNNVLENKIILTFNTL
jgi:hypothetical protein